ncbi:hypothetical protein RSOL_429710 [Rhizoctonia solani AG-3 Rhs1AP]|uniref:Uncharacterized protein n=1 Tax=Rhizoctonia solani AG-3 Rhs1AP TaxID=1086054 RepID=X8JKV3_9AGAM|nr:hypothetical protein RSOL_429710 [Rhizoctonia solani AG-3 Rhs1AP]
MALLPHHLSFTLRRSPRTWVTQRSSLTNSVTSSAASRQHPNPRRSRHPNKKPSRLSFL